jgi:hypothetical protein
VGRRDEGGTSPCPSILAISERIEGRRYEHPESKPFSDGDMVTPRSIKELS